MVSDFNHCNKICFLWILEIYNCQQKNIVLCIEVLSHDRRKRDVLENRPNQNYEEFSPYEEQNPFIEMQAKYLQEDVMD